MAFRVRQFQILALALVHLILFGVTGCAHSVASDAPGPKNSAVLQAQLPASILNEIAGYSGWRKANPKPYFVPNQTAVLCAAPVPQPKSNPNPHEDKFITVYVNEIGRQALTEAVEPKFPVGSIIIKEKHPTRESTQPELLTVMIKRQAGFNPEAGDWEFAAIDGDAKKIQAQGKLENCQGCHIPQKAQDYVFRTYMARGVRRL
ncbi:MAG TPA: cytochrome P460 family protein [Acidobacteriota bacterium]|nr:cytochrome P460 family protein [Acidobacteriota bacterium]HNH82960.1 cytochrome P460 family protein [Acidobacteriota bacterium]HNJ40056.1 cytochrome P460 family protein [Acidobacteriota bacterium]